MAHPHSPADAAEGNSSPDDDSNGPRLGRKNRTNAGEAPAQTPPGPKKSPRNGRRPHRKGRPHRRTTTSSRCLTALAALTLLLTACRIDAKFEFKEDGSAHTEIIVEDNTGSMQRIDSSCEDLKTIVTGTVKFLSNAKTEDVTTPGGRLKCKITSDNQPDRVTFSETQNSYIFTLNGLKIREKYDGSASITTIITTPGKVVKSDVGTVKGNKVVVKGLNYVINGFQIISEKPNSSTSPKSSQNDTKDVNSGGSTTKSAFPAWAWASIGCGALAVLLAAMLAVRTKKRRRRDSGSYSDPRRYLDHTRQTGSHPPYGS